MTTLEMDRSLVVAPLVEPLTRRERVVLANLAEDVTLEEIAARLFVTRNTVKSQVRSVYRKIGVSNRADAVAWAVAAGIR
jgi:LuxR family transcriptional regulator of spore coat protein